MTILTSNYKTNNIKFLLDDLESNLYYLFVSTVETNITANSKFHKNDFLEKTIFGKKILEENAFYMIRNYSWQFGTVYDQYDDREDMSTKVYYIVVSPENNNTGVYRIYKCLFNNYGAVSVNPPNYIEYNSSNYNDDNPCDDVCKDILNQIYRTADGYVWKYMYSITELDYTRYNTLGFVPITETVANTSIIESSIDEIFIDNVNENSGYEKVEGVIEQVGTTITVIAPNLNEFPNYYAGQYFYVTNTNNISEVYQINSYSYSDSTKRGSIILSTSFDTNVVATTSTFKILPRVEILGDGSGAVAIPQVEKGNIKSILVLERGEGYTNAVANIVDPFGFDPLAVNSSAVRALIRPILSPKGGHASNFEDELSSRHCLLYTGITSTDNNTIPLSNEYTKVGIIKNPEFKDETSPAIFNNTIQLHLKENILVPNEIITQLDSNDQVIFKGRVHSVDNNIVYISEYMGPYQNINDSDISLDLSGDIPIRSEQNQLLFINTDNDPPYPVGYPIGYPGYTLSNYVQRTGEVYYMNSFSPIERTDESKEEYKIILEF